MEIWKYGHGNGPSLALPPFSNTLFSEIRSSDNPQTRIRRRQRRATPRCIYSNEAGEPNKAILPLTSKDKGDARGLMRYTDPADLPIASPPLVTSLLRCYLTYLQMSCLCTRLRPFWPEEPTKPTYNTPCIKGLDKAMGCLSHAPTQEKLEETPVSIGPHLCVHQPAL